METRAWLLLGQAVSFPGIERWLDQTARSNKIENVRTAMPVEWEW